VRHSLLTNVIYFQNSDLLEISTRRMVGLYRFDVPGEMDRFGKFSWIAPSFPLPGRAVISPARLRMWTVKGEP
jgi:hypothetical protein